jgi:hypothetical protein
MIRHPLYLDGLFQVLHDRGVINEDALEHVCGDLVDGKPLSRDHLIQIFGPTKIFHLLTIPDETARQLVREAVELLTNADCALDIRDWVRAAEAVVGPITFQQAVDVELAQCTFCGGDDDRTYCSKSPSGKHTTLTVSETSETRGPRP